MTHVPSPTTSSHGLPPPHAVGSAETLASLCGPAVEFPRGTVLFRQGERPRALFLIEHGLVKHVRSVSSGRGDVHEVIAGLRGAPSVVGSSSAVTDELHVTTAVALTLCTFRSIDAGAFRLALDANPSVSQFVHRLHAGEIRGYIVRAGDTALPAAEQLARLISRLVQAGLTTPCSAGIYVDVPLTQEELGQMVGVGREHVSRLFGILERRGVVKRDRRRILIPATSPLVARDAARGPGRPRQ